MNIRTGDNELIKELNENLVFRSLMRRQPTSRVRLSKETNLTLSTVLKIVREFQEKGFITEHSIGESSGGRRPTLLRVNPEGGYVIGVNLDVLHTTVALLDLNGDVKRKIEFPTHAERNPEVVLQSLNEVISKLIDDFHIEKGFRDRILGVGISLPAKVDYKNGILGWSVNLGWRDVPMRSIISDACGLEVYIDDDTKAMTIGEHWFRKTGHSDNLVMIYVAGGLGIGVVINGSIYRGVTGTPGGFSHVPIVKDGPQCRCGNRGCLETFVGEVPVLSRVQEAIEKGTETTLANIVKNGEGLKLSHIFHSAREGDRFAKEIVDEMVDYTSLTISIAETAYDPGVIVLGGPVIEEGGEELFEIIKLRAQEKVIREKGFLNLRIERSILGENAPVIGAATLVYQELFKLSPVYV